MKKIKDVSKRVKKLLEDIPDTRDSDNLLIMKIWYDDLRKLGYNPELIPATTFFTEFMLHKLTPAESVRRSRQILEVAYPGIRGLSYEKRHGKIAKEVKADVRETQFEAILDSKYTQITPEILKTLKAGQEIYFTHPDAEDLCNSGMCNFRANSHLFTMGRKYIIMEIYDSSFQCTDNDNVANVNPCQFSILSKK